MDKPIKIVIVEDSPVAAEFIKYICEDAGIEVIGIAKTGEELFSLLDHAKPDVITVDIHLPDIDGYRLVYDIISKHNIPAVVITGTVPPADTDKWYRALDAGATAILEKPVGISSPKFGTQKKRIQDAVKHAAHTVVGFGDYTTGTKILIVEDDPLNAELLVDLAKAAGHQTKWVDNAEAALIEVNVYKPDIILMDIALPGMDGLQATKRIKAKENRCIVIVTAHAMTHTREECRMFGCDGFITKPIDTRIVMRQVEAYYLERRDYR